MEYSGHEQLLREGIAAARAGERERARALLLQVIAQDEGVEAAWLWLSGVVDDPGEQQICLENVLTLNPNNQPAKKGLRWLSQQSLGMPSDPESRPADRSTEAPHSELSPPLMEPDSRKGISVPDPEAVEPARIVLSPISAEPASPEPAARVSVPDLRVEIDPFACPYCAGPVSGDQPRCDHCGRRTALRYRKRTRRSVLGWLVGGFLLLGAVSGLEGYVVSQLVLMGRFPKWLGNTALRFGIGSALLSPDGVGADLVQLAATLVLINYILAGLCVLGAIGLALKNRIAYFGSFILAALIVAATAAGLLTGLTGWLPALFRLGLVAICVKWLADSGAAFEWESQLYYADIDPDLRTDLDYYSRGQHYGEIGMWAKAAAHWQVASRLAPRQAQYHAALADAYARIDWPQAALVQAERALAISPDNEELHALRDSLAELAESQ